MTKLCRDNSNYNQLKGSELGYLYEIFQVFSYENIGINYSIDLTVLL